MSRTEQIPILFSQGHAQQAGRLWLGLAIDHRRLFDALQAEWLPPPDDALGSVLGIRSFVVWGGAPTSVHRIATRVKLDPSLLPNFKVHVWRLGQWELTDLGSIRSGDAAVYWPGPLPTFAISALFVPTPEEQVRVTGLARQVANVALPATVETGRAGDDAFTDFVPPAGASQGLSFPPDLDALRGAMAMAVWGVPQTDPWLELLSASLSLGRPPIGRLAGAVDAPWWRWPPWGPPACTEADADLQSRMWLAAIRVLRDRNADGVVAAADMVNDMRALIAATASEHDLADMDSWRRETLGILRADSKIQLDNWKSGAVGKALQLVLARPSPSAFRTWRDDLPLLPPAVWWSAVTLCGLLHGYRRLDLQFRGDAVQRRLFAVHALRVCDVGRRSLDWPSNPGAELTWRRESGRVVFSLGGTDFLHKSVNARGQWFTANLQDGELKAAATEMARRFGWPCLYRDIVLNDDRLVLSGPGAAELAEPSRELTVRGSLRLRLSAKADYEETLDSNAFLHCVATEGGVLIAPPPATHEHRGYEHRWTESTVEHAIKDNAVDASLVANGVPGLIYVRDFLTDVEETELVSSVDGAMWLTVLKRRVQHYGWRYDYKARRIVSSMRLGPLPPWATDLARRLAERGLVPHIADQVIANEYVGKQGISKHVDCVPCFADGIAMVSLLDSWEMIFREQRGTGRVPLVLERRSVAVLTGDARYGWSHEIPARLVEPSGTRRHRRVSLTFRKVNEPSRRTPRSV
jgi:alkylated DNA repair dioxygenase AlkB